MDLIQKKVENLELLRSFPSDIPWEHGQRQAGSGSSLWRETGM